MYSNQQKEVLKIATNRLGLIPVVDLEAPGTTKNKLIVLSELASLGYKVSNPDSYTDSILKGYADLIDTLKEKKGGRVEYVPLFQGFPNDVPDQNEYFIRRIVGYVANFIGTVDEGRELDNGIKVPEWLFDLKEFGADPISQFQDKSLYNAGVRNQKKRKRASRTEWTTLRFASAEETIQEVKQFLLSNLYAKSSIKEALKPDIQFLLNTFGIEEVNPEKLLFKETKTYIQKYYWDKSDWFALKLICSAPTDLLRLFAAITDSDISLSAPIKFPKFTRPQRKIVLEVLEKFSNLSEDMNSYKGLWIEIGRFLHPGEYKDKYPKAYEAFDVLRHGKVITYNSKVEAALEGGYVQTLVGLLQKRPGIFARKIHQILETLDKNQTDIILNAFKHVAHKVALKNLLVLESCTSSMDESKYKAIINKQGRINVLKNKKHRLPEKKKIALIEIISQAIRGKMQAEKDSWQGKTVWIDNALKNYTVPLQQRKMSDSLLTLGRGSQLPLGEGLVLRLFTYWKESTQTTDLDLSLIGYDENMDYKGHVSYTNLTSMGIVHSGDIQSAPDGAAEFIDINLEDIRKTKFRYIAMEVLKYSGDNFGQMDCHAGWMLRDNTDSNIRSFDIKTVQNKFDLTGSSAYSIPIMIDLKENKIIFVDLYVGGLGGGNTVEGVSQNISLITREVVRMINTRPNMLQLVKHNAIGRGAEIIQSKSGADITCGLEDCDYDVKNVEKILNELI